MHLLLFPDFTQARRYSITYYHVQFNYAELLSRFDAFSKKMSSY